MNPSRLSDQLVLVAKGRLSSDVIRNEAALRRATSDLYYAVFHAICEAVTSQIGADVENPAFVETYKAMYRQLEHSQAEKRCKAVAKDERFSPEISRFAKLFVTLKNKREKADYDPLEQFSISAIRNDCGTAETRLRDFWSAPQEERVHFACYVALRRPRESPA